MNGWTSGTSWLAGAAGAIGMGAGVLSATTTEVGSYVVGVLAASAESHQGEAFSVILADAQQDLVDHKRAEDTALAATVATLRSEYNTFLSGLGNPDHITNDTLNYTLTEYAGAENVSTASAVVTINMDVFNYFNLVSALNEYYDSHLEALSTHRPLCTNITAIYCESLLKVADTMGWHDGWSLWFYQTGNRWDSWTTDYWYFDAHDVCDELNSIGYPRQPGW